MPLEPPGKVLQPAHAPVWIQSATTTSPEPMCNKTQALQEAAINHELLGHIRHTTTLDPFAQKHLGNPTAPFQAHDGLLWFNEHIYVPDGAVRLELLKNCHDSPLAGHFGH